MNPDGTGQPYRAAAADYVDSGWWPIPVSSKDGKTGIPSGFTGCEGARVEQRHVSEWVSTRPHDNIALRLPPDVVCIDVDDYDGKPGGQTLADLQDRLGILPPTWVSTARDLPSGKYLFRVPTGTRLRSKMGPGIDVCQFHHRYVMVAPSFHHTGAPVRWLDSADDEVADRLPEPADLPDLPWSWLEEFSASGSGKVGAPAGPERVDEWHRSRRAAQRPGWLPVVVRRVEESIARGDARHDSMLTALCTVAIEAEAGAYPATEAVAELKRIWERATTDEGRASEFDNMLSWAVGQIDTEDAPARIAGIRDRLGRSRAPNGTAVPPGVVEPNLITDADVAQAFGETIRGRYLHCAELGGWMQWDEVRWRRDRTEQVFEAARQYVIELGQQLVQTDVEGHRAKKALSYRNKTRIEAIVTLARRLHHVAASAEEFDQHPDLLCCDNGVVDLRTGELAPHRPELRLTATTGVSYRPGASHPDVSAVLDVVEPDVRDWLQVVFGYAATGHVSEDLLPVFDGQGSNGKTTLLKAVSAALGEYASPAPQRLIMRSGTEEHPTLIADLFGRRLVTIEETAEGRSLRLDSLKMLTGGSKIKARFIAKDYFEFTPTHQLIMATNHRPAVNSTDHATWRRLRLIPFPFRYARPGGGRPTDRPVDLKLRDRLVQPDRKEAMLAWVVEGAIRWHQTGLPTCPDVDRETGSWRRSEDTIQRFADERLRFELDATTRATVVYEAYRGWCEGEGRPPRTAKEFSKQLEQHDLMSEHGVLRKKTNRGQSWIGLAVAEGDAGDARSGGYA